MANTNDLVIILTDVIEEIVNQKISSIAVEKYELTSEDFDNILEYVKENYDPSDSVSFDRAVTSVVEGMSFEISVYG